MVLEIELGFEKAPDLAIGESLAAKARYEIPCCGLRVADLLAAAVELLIHHECTRAVAKCDDALAVQLGVRLHHRVGTDNQILRQCPYAGQLRSWSQRAA